jgi:hypothetical protein
MKRVLEHEPSAPAVAQISATCDAVTVPLPSPVVPPPLPPPDPVSALVAPPLPPTLAARVVLVRAGVETDTDGLAVAVELDVLASIPASAAAVPVPPAAAPVPAPLLLAEAVPLANASVAVLLAVVSTEPSDAASVCAIAEAEPSPTEFADTFAVADEDAEALPSVPVLVAVPWAAAAAVPPITPLPKVETLMAASAVEDECAETSSDETVLEPSADALPWASPSSVEVPAKSADSVEPSEVADFASAVPAAVAPTPAVTRSTEAFTAPFAATPVAPLLFAVTSPDAPPIAPAFEVDDESEVLPAPSSLCAVALPPADAEAPAPLAVASECDDVVDPPAPELELLDEWASADAASAAVDFSQPVWLSGAIGAAASIKAKALVESTSPSLSRCGLFIWVLLQQDNV